MYLARRFVHGRLSIDEMPLIYPDYIIWQGHTYFPLGPVPAILLIPFLPLIDLRLAARVDKRFSSRSSTSGCSIRSLGKFGVLGDQRRWILLLFFGGTAYFSVAATMIFLVFSATSLPFFAYYWLYGRFLADGE